MNKVTIGYLLLGGAAVVWAWTYYQQEKQLSAGTITAEETLGFTDYIFSVAGVAFVAGVVLAGPHVYHAVKAKIG